VPASRNHATWLRWYFFGADKFTGVIGPTESLIKIHEGKWDHIVRVMAALAMFLQEGFDMLVECNHACLQDWFSVPCYRTPTVSLEYISTSVPANT
jgi:hypothetical protein